MCSSVLRGLEFSGGKLGGMPIALDDKLRSSKSEGGEIGLPPIERISPLAGPAWGTLPSRNAFAMSAAFHLA